MRTRDILYNRTSLNALCIQHRQNQYALESRTSNANFSNLRISPDIVDLATEQDLLWTGEPSWQNPSWDFPEEHASLQYVHDWNMKMAASPASAFPYSYSSQDEHQHPHYDHYDQELVPCLIPLRGLCYLCSRKQRCNIQRNQSSLHRLKRDPRV